ncbi:MAG: phosphoribosylanthranilate isomerase [archaeon]
MTKVKICGITNVEDAKLAVESGADALGFIFYEKSKRSVDKEDVREIVRSLPPFVAKVGVFVDEDEDVVRQIQAYCGLTCLQFHGSETKEYCGMFNNVIKAFRVKDRSSLDAVREYEPYVSAIHLDNFKLDVAGGTGEVFDWNALRGFSSRKPIILSGGITEANVAEAIGIVKPYAIDSASGTEKEPGRKDHARMKRLINLVKRVN